MEVGQYSVSHYVHFVLVSGLLENMPHKGKKTDRILALKIVRLQADFSGISLAQGPNEKRENCRQVSV